jgi:hypothetical protein
MNTKHTPAPWYIGVATSTIESPIGEKFFGVGSAEGRGICRVSRLSTLDNEDEANASLIAAAPELLAACELAVKSLASFPDRAAVVQAAIAKAKGETQ